MKEQERLPGKRPATSIDAGQVHQEERREAGWESPRERRSSIGAIGGSSGFGWGDVSAAGGVTKTLASGLSIQRMPADESTAEEPESDEKDAKESGDARRRPHPRLIVDDDEKNPGSGQMTKSAFLAELQTSICAAAEEAFKGTKYTVQACPWIDHWFRYYRRRSASHTESAIFKYVPGMAPVGSATEYIPVLTERVRRAIGVWVATGRVTGVPEETPTGMPPMEAPPGSGGGAGTPQIMPKAKEGGIQETMNPLAVRDRLGSGQALDAGVGAKMGSAFGHDFSGVRVHADATAAELNQRLNARAFTVGNHVAFGRSQYRPGTLAGEGLIAHELAHVVQQRGASSVEPASSYSALESDADRATVGVMSRLHGSGKGSVLPAVSSGLSLQRCRPDGELPYDIDPGRTSVAPRPSEAQAIEKLTKLNASFETIKSKEGTLDALTPIPVMGDPTSAGAGLASSMTYNDELQKFDEYLGTLGIGGSTELDSLRNTFATYLQRNAIATAFELLDKSEKQVDDEAARYAKRDGLIELYAALEPLRQKLPVRPKSISDQIPLPEGTKKGLGVDRINQPAMPMDGRLMVIGYLDEFEQGRKKARPTIAALAREFPILADQSIDPWDLAVKAKDMDVLRAALEKAIANKRKSIGDTRQNLHSTPEMIWQMDPVLTRTYAKLNIQPGGIFDDVAHRERKKIEAMKFVKDMALAALSILAVVLTEGAAAPVVWGGRAVGAGISLYGAKEHYDDYTAMSEAADTAFDQADALSAEKPSLFWLALDITLSLMQVGGAIGSARRMFASRLFSRLESSAAKAVSREITVAKFGEEVDRLTPAVKSEVTQEMKALGYSDKKIADELGFDVAKLKQSVQERAQALLDGAPGVNITSKADALKYDRIIAGGVHGAGTAVTDLQAFESVIGKLPAGNRMVITKAQAAALEKALGLPTGRLAKGGIISIVEDVGLRAPRSPLQGNGLFLGGGKGLPGGGPEVNVAPISTAGGGGIRQIIVDVK